MIIAGCCLLPADSILLGMSGQQLLQLLAFGGIQLWPVGDQFLFVLLVAAAHVLRLHHLPVEFAAKDAECNVQLEEETLQWRKFFVVLFGECIGDLLAGEHGEKRCVLF